jgi:peptide chain release factor 2
VEKKDFVKQMTEISSELKILYETLDIKNKATELSVLTKKTQHPDFWNDSTNAQSVIFEQNELRKTVDKWHELSQQLDDLMTLMEMIEEDNDDQTFAEFIIMFNEFKKIYDTFTIEALFSDIHDHNNAFLEIHSGEGGVDAQDFAQILLRMYLRWIEQNGMQYDILTYQNGDEAGIKTAVVFIKGDYVYGKLRSEIGVHRLIRLSPFDTAKRRHTSFASVAVTPEIDETIDLVISETELRIDTFRSSGAGGQSVNTTDSAVRITHLPTGIVVTCQNERSQIQNREQALKMLYAKVYALEEQKKANELENLTGEKRDIGFGSQIRSYVFHPYNMVKDHRTNFEVGNVSEVIDGGINGFVEAYLKQKK